MARVALVKPKENIWNLPSYQAREYTRLRAQLRIDGMRLGEEFMDQPSLVMDIGEICAFAVSVRETVANEQKEVRASAAADLRKTAKSESQVTAQLDGHPWVQEGLKKYEQAKLDASLWQALQAAAVAKTSALKHLSELTVSGWLTPNSMGAQRQIEGRAGKPNPHYHGNHKHDE